MQFSIVAVLAAATAVSAGYAGNVTYTTEVVTAYTTYCPEPTTITYGEKTYTITEATTLTITDCPCTVSKPVYTTSSVECHDCPSPSPSPEPPVYSEPPVYPPPANTTLVHVPTTAVPEPSDVPAGAAKAAALSGAGLAGVLGFAALLL